MICEFGFYESCDIKIGKTKYSWRGVCSPLPSVDWFPPSTSHWSFAKTEDEIQESLKQQIVQLFFKCEKALGLEWKSVDDRDDIPDSRILLFDGTYNRPIIGDRLKDFSGFESSDDFLELTHWKKIITP